MHKTQWKTSDFDFDLPPELIAQRPSAQRGESTLLCLPPEGAPRLMSFSEICDLFRGDECLILNDTRVGPARLRGQKKTGGQVEVFFLELSDEILSDEILSDEVLERSPQEIDLSFWAMTRGKLKPTHQVNLPLGASAVMIRRDDQGRALFGLTLPISIKTQYESAEIALWAWLDEAGKIPLPPYIDREPDAEDRARYQTVFARSPGAVAAPTAGLHFTDELLDQLRAKGVQIYSVTLHVGPGTFLPVKSDTLSEHVMHHERYSVPLETQEALRSGRPIIAVGTTVVRAIESFCTLTETDPQIWGDLSERSTDIFITPGYSWRAVDGLLTNFHLPQSTLLMLVAAFVGYERALDAYQTAITHELQFYSYGDASLLSRPGGRWPMLHLKEED